MAQRENIMTIYTKDQELFTMDILSREGNSFYDILGLNLTASEEEIKNAYRSLAMELHPDKNKFPGASEAFNLVTKAFKILNNEAHKSFYDKFGNDPSKRKSVTSNVVHKRDPNGDILNSFLRTTPQNNDFVVVVNNRQKSGNEHSKLAKKSKVEILQTLLPLILLMALPLIEILLFD